MIGALWIAHRNEPLWEHAARTLLVLVAVPLLAAPVLVWWRKRHGSADTRRVSLVRFVAAKALLVGVALGVDVLLSLWLPGLADFLVAGGLFAAIGARTALPPPARHGPPPLLTSTWPVTHRPASLASQAMRRAASSGSPHRPIGSSASTAACAAASA